MGENSLDTGMRRVFQPSVQYAYNIRIEDAATIDSNHSNRTVRLLFQYLQRLWCVWFVFGGLFSASTTTTAIFVKTNLAKIVFHLSLLDNGHNGVRRDSGTTGWNFDI